MARRKKVKTPPRVPCGSCHSGFQVVERDGKRVAVRCICWTAWKRGAPKFTGRDYKVRAAGEQA